MQGINICGSERHLQEIYFPADHADVRRKISENVCENPRNLRDNFCENPRNLRDNFCENLRDNFCENLRNLREVFFPLIENLNFAIK